MTKLIVGLGNPGQRYAHTRHNVGFDVIDALADKWGVTVNALKWKAKIGETRREGEKILLMKPQTYMNLSGEAVREAVAFYRLAPQDVIVVLDDVDIRLGTVRIRERGSAGTHNGLRSVVKELGFTDFPRIRLSIGRRPAPMDIADFVLSHFSDAEWVTITEERDAAVQAVETMLKDGPTAAMNQWNGWLAPSMQQETEEQRAREEQLEAERARQDEFLKHAKRCGE
ncbi:MAG: aminoacyl-tRNA hydrolase [Peptoniphilaceae bacterium]|nr:aminoacyl-tRNA hydrolase [Peptoniphilaceae bacterium]MDY6085953.1 aminoacyl-tRNA hydrolase [Peptoniphilaceae bacterium]